MELILLERVEKLGLMGDVVSVKPGYARNFLLPRGKALRATKQNLADFEARKAQLEADNIAQRDEAQAVAERVEGLSVVLVRQASDVGHLYGSVNARDIAAAVTAAGFTINRAQVRLDKPIKALGLHEVKIALHPEVSVAVTANVARSEEDAAEQAKTGAAVTSEGKLLEEEAEIAVEQAAEAAADAEAADENL